jgi:transposase
MANRYDIPFKEKLEQQYKKPLLDVLIHFRNKRMSIKEVSDITGFHYSTVRYWCSKYAITMHGGQRFHPKANLAQKRERHFVELFKAKTINTFNVLSRRW